MDKVETEMEKMHFMKTGVSCRVGPAVKMLATQTKIPEFQYPKLTKIPGLNFQPLKVQRIPRGTWLGRLTVSYHKPWGQLRDLQSVSVRGACLTFTSSFHIQVNTHA